MDPVKLPKLHVTAVGRENRALQTSLHDFFWNINCWVKFSIRPADFYNGLKLVAVHRGNLLQK
jgi:hypothetical protein